jgi:ubiquinone/menaquinone biosynthesis C-methylase UbiE
MTQREGDANVERRTWLDARRASIQDRYDQVFAPTYDENDTSITATHRRFVDQVIESCPPGGTILDAPCGTGRYFGLVMAAGRRVVGIDQSAGMLAEARSKHPEAVLEQVGLQELAFDARFDAAICVDSMEYVAPEDWPVVLANLRRAVRPGGLIYLTVEQIDAAEIAAVFAEARADGLPVVPGEHVRRGGGYHHYPTEDQVARWLAASGLDVVEEGRSSGGNYGYHHLLVRSAETTKRPKEPRVRSLQLPCKHRSRRFRSRGPFRQDLP